MVALPFYVPIKPHSAPRTRKRAGEEVYTYCIAFAGATNAMGGLLQYGMGPGGHRNPPHHRRRAHRGIDLRTP